MDDLTERELFQAQQALDFRIWSLCDDLSATLSALMKIDEDAGKQARNDVIDAVAKMATADEREEA